MAGESAVLSPEVVQQLKNIARIVLAESPSGGNAPLASSRGLTGDNRPVLLGKTVGSHAKGVSQDVAIYSGDTIGSETDTGLTIEAYNRFADLSDDVWVHLRGVSRGWELTAAEC